MKATKQSKKLNISRFVAEPELQPCFAADRLNSLALKIANAVGTIAAVAYINGLEIPDSLCFKILKNSLAIAYQKFPSLLITYDWVAKESDLIAEGSQELMDIQYNLSGELFKLILGESQLMYPKYSMALWDKGALNLEQAQIAMLEDLIAKVGIQDGDEILDLGCGWGSAANYILQKFPNARVTGLNLSYEQCKYIRQHINNSNNSFSWDRFTLCEVDLNQIVFAHKFDKIISIGAFERVENLTKSFEKVASFLKPEGKVLIDIISTRLPNNIWSPFIQKYIFSYARVWQYDVIPNCNKHLKTVNRWYINGLNYARTLRAWLENFDRNQDIIKTLDFGQDYAKFRRIWRFYLILCAAYFEAGEGQFLGNGQYLMIPQQ